MTSKPPCSTKAGSVVLSKYQKWSGTKWRCRLFISRTSELDRVYATIERELRSQYLLAYQSTLEGDSFRTVEVSLLPPGLKAKTIAGYQP